MVREPVPEQLVYQCERIFVVEQVDLQVWRGYVHGAHVRCACPMDHMPQSSRLKRSNLIAKRASPFSLQNYSRKNTGAHAPVIVTDGASEVALESAQGGGWGGGPAIWWVRCNEISLKFSSDLYLLVGYPVS
ncbi:hypothetical protein AVEN_15612-1 [Araneus ventricosus]|uniref:Uncharacterized protein n=1 Tax=Araneus ventricosus TaxID=182803 RepID=A0A4Y2RBW0_ARAVE|nr:hypothetical protein AVEN_15612-1 [Araneus ventricosus]